MPNHVREARGSHHSSEEKYRNWKQYEQRRKRLDPFKDLFQRDPRVCDNCFTLRYEEVKLEWWRGDDELGWMPFEQFIPIAPQDRHQEFHPEEIATGTLLTCGRCGHRNTKHRPQAKESVREIADHICETLTEKGIDHDSRLLKHTVERRNTSANQGKQDSHVFSPAVHAAIEAEHEDVQQVVQRHLYVAEDSSDREFQGEYDVPESRL